MQDVAHCTGQALASSFVANDTTEAYVHDNFHLIHRSRPAIATGDFLLRSLLCFFMIFFRIPCNGQEELMLTFYEEKSMEQTQFT